MKQDKKATYLPEDEALSESEQQLIQDVRRTIESFSWTYESLQEHLNKEVDMSDLSVSLSGLKEVRGFIAAAVANAESGMALETLGGGSDFDIEVAAAVNSDVIKAKLAAMEALGFGSNEKIEDILITLGSQYHLIRPYSKDPNYFIYLALDKSQSNLAMARRSLTKAEESLDF